MPVAVRRYHCRRTCPELRNLSQSGTRPDRHRNRFSPYPQSSFTVRGACSGYNSNTISPKPSVVIIHLIIFPPARTCLKTAFRQMCVTLGDCSPKWDVQMAGIIFKTRSTPAFITFSAIRQRQFREPFSCPSIKEMRSVCNRFSSLLQTLRNRIA